MEISSWPSNYVARCHVQMFEAAGGSGSWLPRGEAGEFHLTLLGNAVLYFQLRNVLDNEILFEHTMHKPDSLKILSQRFFAIQLETGSFRGFGFGDFAAAREMKEHIQNAIKPHNLEEHAGENFTGAKVSNGKDKPSEKDKSTVCASKPGDSCVPRHTSIFATQSLREERESSSWELVTYSETVESSKWKLSWKRLTSFSYLRRWSAVTEAFRWQEQEMEIGYPTDVKHVAHVGWDGPSVRGPSWIDELKQSPNYATGPFKEFGQPTNSDWIDDALSAAKWTSPGHGDQVGPPPPLPAEFLDPILRKDRNRLSCFDFVLFDKYIKDNTLFLLSSAFEDNGGLEEIYKGINGLYLNFLSKFTF
ncbi:hypothetical protein L7F22_011031 [Adiantum nelumboides]|nr:hypothetical protein [Adiantum nelumboides]